VTHRQQGRFALVGHYFASVQGKALAERIASRLAARALVAAAPRVAATPGFLVQQASAVAVSVDLPAPATDRADDEAYALYLALLEDLGGDPATFVPLEVRLLRGGAPAASERVALDHRWALVTDADGVARFDGLPPRAVVTVEAGPASSRVTLPRKGPVTLVLPAAR